MITGCCCWICSISINGQRELKYYRYKLRGLRQRLGPRMEMSFGQSTKRRYRFKRHNWYAVLSRSQKKLFRKLPNLATRRDSATKTIMISTFYYSSQLFTSKHNHAFHVGAWLRGISWIIIWFQRHRRRSLLKQLKGGIRTFNTEEIIEQSTTLINSFW